MPNIALKYRIQYGFEPIFKIIKTLESTRDRLLFVVSLEIKK